MSRRRVIVGSLAVVALAVIAIVLIAATGGDDDKNTTVTQAATGLAARTVKAGAVTVKIEPQQLDARGAAFKITFDTHSVDLSSDMTRATRLEVGGAAWKVAGWTGDGPGGHHREGELRFTPAGPAAGNARLTISGLPGPVAATWELGS